MQDLKIVVIGAGPAGVTAAFELSKNRCHHVTLIEADTQVGGMAKTIDLWGQRVDLGPHRFFTFNHDVQRIWQDSLGKSFDVVNRLTRIFYKGKFFKYPLQVFDVAKNLGFFESTQCILSYLYAVVFPNRGELNFKSWVINRFGSRLYNKFFKTYTEKLWGIPCENLSAEFAIQRIKKLSVFEIVKAALKLSPKRHHKSLIEKFLYPHRGTGIVYENMACQIIKNGGTVRLGTKVHKVQIENRKVMGVQIQDGSILHADIVISTMPITTLVKNMDSLPSDVSIAAQALKFRNTILVYLEIDSVLLFKDQWLYVHSESLNTGRITNFRNWSPSLYGDAQSTIVCMEFWCYNEDAIWTADDESISKMANEEIKKTGLIHTEKILNNKVIRIPRCYPVYADDYKKNLNLIIRFLKNVSGLHVIGRAGSFKYNNQDHSILMGLIVAENIQGANHDSWSINNDYEYQEESRNGSLICYEHDSNQLHNNHTLVD